MADSAMMVFAGNAHPQLANAIASYLHLPLGKASIGHFSDGEVAVEVAHGGGGIFIAVASFPIIRNNTIADNAASGGGGIFVTNGSVPRIENNAIIDNRAEKESGGGMIVTANSAPIVRGNTIRARPIGRDIMAGLRNIVGGEIVEYTKMVAESREQALDRMTAQARDLNADAVVGVRFMTSSMMQGAAELLAYGTAVRLEDG